MSLQYQPPIDRNRRVSRKIESSEQDTFIVQKYHQMNAVSGGTVYLGNEDREQWRKRMKNPPQYGGFTLANGVELPGSSEEAFDQWSSIDDLKRAIKRVHGGYALFEQVAQEYETRARLAMEEEGARKPWESPKDVGRQPNPTKPWDVTHPQKYRVNTDSEEG